MGNPKQKWTPEEEAALRAGVDKHGAGKWRTIQKDPEFAIVLSTRSNVDLKVSTQSLYEINVPKNLVASFVNCIIAKSPYKLRTHTNTHIVCNEIKTTAFIGMFITFW